MAVVDDKIFYQGSTNGIYGFFRGNKPIMGNIIKPTGSKNKKLEIIGSYLVHWNTIKNNSKYCLLEISS